MKNIAIICDSSISLTDEEAKNLNVYIAPLTVIHNNNEYLDQIELTQPKIKEILERNEPVSTSQPNLGHTIELFEKIKAEGYDQVYALTVTKNLSGTHQVMVQAKEMTGFDNLVIFDTMNLVGPIQRAVVKIHEMNKAGKSNEEIIEAINDHFATGTESYLIPRDLKQLKAGGRISPAAATMASLLRIKPVLKLSLHGEAIDKFETARTNAKTYDHVINDLIKHNVTPDKYNIDLLEYYADDMVEEFKAKLEEKIGVFDIKESMLPSSLAAHAGLGTIAIQYSKK